MVALRTSVICRQSAHDKAVSWRKYAHERGTVVQKEILKLSNFVRVDKFRRPYLDTFEQEICDAEIRRMEDQMKDIQVKHALESVMYKEFIRQFEIEALISLRG